MRSTTQLPAILGSLVLLLGACAAPAPADVFQLHHGGLIQGQLLNPEEEPRTRYIVQTADGRVTLEADQVTNHEPESEAARRYRQLLHQMPNTADGNWKMAQWCASVELLEQREFHLREVIRLEPDHVQARRELGYHRTEQGWVNPDEIMRERGMVRHEGKWRLPQEVRLIEEQARQKAQEIQWRTDIKMWRSWIVRRRDRAAEGLQNIQAITDPLAAPVLVELLDDEKEPEALKLHYVDVLGKLAHPQATQALIRHGLNNPSEPLRDRALDWLRQQRSEAALQAFIAALGSKDNQLINRAAVGLHRLADPRATRPLIDALVTKHTLVVAQSSPGSLGVTFGQGGVGGLTTGGGPRSVEREVQNLPVLAALCSLHEGVNFMYDELAWQRWYVRQNTPAEVHLRRLE